LVHDVEGHLGVGLLGCVESAPEPDKVGVAEVSPLVDLQTQVDPVSPVLGVGLGRLLVVLLEGLDAELCHVGAVLLLVLEFGEFGPLGLNLVAIVGVGNPCIQNQ